MTDFLSLPTGRKTLKYDKIVSSQKVKSDKCIYICCPDLVSISLTPPDITESFDGDFQKPLVLDDGNLRKGVVKFVNVGQQDVFIDNPDGFFYNISGKDKKNQLKLSYGEDMFLLKRDSAWYFY